MGSWTVILDHPSVTRRRPGSVTCQPPTTAAVVHGRTVVLNCLGIHLRWRKEHNQQHEDQVECVSHGNLHQRGNSPLNDSTFPMCSVGGTTTYRLKVRIATQGHPPVTGTAAKVRALGNDAEEKRASFFSLTLAPNLSQTWACVYSRLVQHYLCLAHGARNVCPHGNDTVT